MSELRKALEEYLCIRRALGFELRQAGATLHQFVSFLQEQDASFVTTELALRWAKQPASASPANWAARLSMVRRFAQHRSATDMRTEIPPKGLLPHRYRRKPPYMYRDKDIRRLVEAARGLRSSQGLRPWTYSTLFGLLAATGMRVSEPVALDCEDVDLTESILTIRRTKFGKSRLVPLHSTIGRVLQQYARRRESVHPTPKSRSFFLSDRGTRLTANGVRYVFVQLSRQIGLRGPSDSHGPRLHDLRHRFAVHTMLRWYRAGVDVERNLPQLSTYLGHTHVSDTYWYLSATPELLRLAAGRLDDERGGSA